MTNDDLNDALIDMVIARKKLKDAGIHFEINSAVWQPVKRTSNDPNGFEVVFNEKSMCLCKKIVSSKEYRWSYETEKDCDKVINDLRKKRFKVIDKDIVPIICYGYSFVIFYVNSLHLDIA